jgi:hypothetical protein
VVLRRSRNGQTYRAVWAPDHPLAGRDGYVQEHRMIAWDAGLFSDPTWHVHHRDGNGLNNAIGNLEPCTPGDHRREHAVSDGTVNQFGVWPASIGRCSIEGCELAVASLGWCSAHLTRYRRLGDPLAVRRVSVNTVRPYVLVR